MQKPLLCYSAQSDSSSYRSGHGDNLRNIELLIRTYIGRDGFSHRASLRGVEKIRPTSKDTTLVTLDHDGPDVYSLLGTVQWIQDDMNGTGQLLFYRDRLSAPALDTIVSTVSTYAAGRGGFSMVVYYKSYVGPFEPAKPFSGSIRVHILAIMAVPSLLTSASAVAAAAVLYVSADAMVSMLPTLTSQ